MLMSYYQHLHVIMLENIVLELLEVKWTPVTVQYDVGAIFKMICKGICDPFPRREFETNYLLVKIADL